MKPEFRLNQFFFICFLFGPCLFPRLLPAGPAADQFITVSTASEQREGTEQDVAWSLEAMEYGIRCSIELFTDKPQEPTGMQGSVGWGYRVEIDGITILNESIPETERSISTLIPVNRLPDGDHTIILTVQDLAGKRHELKRAFQVTGAPGISAVPEENNGGIVDAAITFSFMGGEEDPVGMVDIYVDDRFVDSAEITGEQNNKPVNLSSLAGREIYAGDLAPGHHLVILKASGLNGSSSLHAIPVTGSTAPPEITIQQSGASQFESIAVSFPATSNPIAGVAELHYNRSIILSVRTASASLEISRADILDAFEKHNLNITNQPVILLLSTISATHVERWQMFLFQ